MEVSKAIMRRGSGEYPPSWGPMAHALKTAMRWCCIRCGHRHDPASGHTLAIHHVDMDRSNNRWHNLLVLCQRCHLRIQGKVRMDRPWIFEHSDWFKPYVAGYYASRYLGVELTRDETEARLEELLGLEARAVLGCEPLALGG